MIKESSMKPIGIYVHVPFCAGKCPYCDFYSVPMDDNSINEYTDAACKAILKHSKSISCPVDTIYFGGGTPNLLGEKNICSILNSINENFNLLSPEITIEVNPCANLIDFELLRRCGVNRLSIGMQSANANELALLGRKHSLNDVKNTIARAQNAKIENISLDLMLCIQEQTDASLLRSVEFCKQQNIQHVSAYLLKIEENTPYFFNFKNLKLKNDDEQSHLYLLACEALEKCGFEQYEISNFCRPGFESRHNLKYWNCDEYLGVGPSAHSFVGKKRFFYPKDLKKFLSLEQPVFDCNGGDVEEYLMLKLRLSRGVNNREFVQRFGYNLPKRYFDNAKKYEKHGFTRVSSENINLTRKGFLLSNSLIAEILFN